MSACLCVRVSECVCVTFVVFTDCECRTRPISTDPGSMEAVEYELTWDVFRRAPSRGGRGRRAAVDFVVCFGWGGFFKVFFQFFFFLERTRPAASMRPPCLIDLYTSNYATLFRNITCHSGLNVITKRSLCSRAEWWTTDCCC